MEKFTLFTVLILGLAQISVGNKCLGDLHFDETWKSDLDAICLSKLTNQIQMELTASITYMTMSAYFSNSNSLRPNIAKFFLDSSVEERLHAKKLIEYLQMRGGDINSQTIGEIVPDQSALNIDSVSSALRVALDLETRVTNSIRDIITVCSGEDETKNIPNDYHAADYLTGEFLTEQHEGMRLIAGHLRTLSRMETQYGKLAEVLFDKSIV